MPPLHSFPLSYAVMGRRVLVIGDGENALRKLRLVARTAARPVLHAIAPSPELAAFAAERAIERVATIPDRQAMANAALVFVATDDAARDAACAALAREARVPVNVVDRPSLCDFSVPAIVDRAPIAVAISTDGVAPVIAQRIREAIERLLPPGLGRLGALAGALRATVRERLSTSAARRRFWRAVIDGPAATAAIAGNEAMARRLALRELARAARPTAPGRVALVGAGPGAEDLLTLRAHRLLQDADVIVHDDLVPAAILDMARRDARRIGVGKRKGRHSATQTEINELLVRLAREGHRLVRLKSGDPMVFGRAGEEIAALRAAGVEIEIVPGVTAALAAAADVGASLTRRGIASELVIATGHGAAASDTSAWHGAAAAGATVALYMGRSVADRIASQAIAAGLDPATPVAAIENAGRVDRRILRGPLGDLPLLAGRGDVDGPVLILIGRALDDADLADAETFAARRLLVA